MLCLIARAINVFPLSITVNFFRVHEITPKMMFIMWYSAIRGAVAFALALRFDFEEEKRNVIITTTLVIVLITTIVFGGSTMPLLKPVCLLFLSVPPEEGEQGREEKERGLPKRDLFDQNRKAGCFTEAPFSRLLSGGTINADEAQEIDLLTPPNWFVRFDTDHLKPFFTRKANSKMGSECGSKFSQDFEIDWYKNVKSHSGEDSP
ncbi:Sodium/hydrogen exchanger 8 like protein [Argiope bruennichi]|uniref:Sodium/hydrogen exchanger 8 like protein n=1 Tax=Argiope bruennichi TaxID=94029 RepID=A0A8T0EWV9_ARGBR|nr:Sodium/hydrogen exchanger 8 like protein [Argiope bruennichi]